MLLVFPPEFIQGFQVAAMLASSRIWRERISLSVAHVWHSKSPQAGLWAFLQRDFDLPNELSRSRDMHGKVAYRCNGIADRIIFIINALY
jgi:hypothetical protein